MVTIHVAHEVQAAAADPTPRVLETATMFGLGIDEARTMTIVPPREITLPLAEGGVVFVTGPSGGGKSTLLKLIGLACEEMCRPVRRFDEMPESPDASLVDAFGAALEEAMSHLSLAGLSDAFVMLRRPDELSDGQRYRLRLARLIHETEKRERPSVIIADEFGATLDRITAKVIARNVCKWTRRRRHTFICATTHDDLVEALEPDVLVWKGFGDDMQVLRR